MLPQDLPINFPAQLAFLTIFYFDLFPIYFQCQIPYLHTPTAGTYLEFPLRLTNSSIYKSTCVVASKTFSAITTVIENLFRSSKNG
jgi:hypothetical protein